MWQEDGLQKGKNEDLVILALQPPTDKLAPIFFVLMASRGT